MAASSHTCTADENCELTLRQRDFGPTRAYPRPNRRTPQYVPAADVDTCAALQRDGDRCDNDVDDDTHVCDVHGGSLRGAAKRGFSISTVVYAAAVHLRTDEGKRAPHVRMVERKRPRGAEYECPHHGRQSLGGDVPARFD